jgi:serine/threonine protein kinase
MNNRLNLTIIVDDKNMISDNKNDNLDDLYFALKDKYRFSTQSYSGTSEINKTLYGTVRLGKRLSDNKKVAIKISNKNLADKHLTEDYGLVLDNVRDEAKILHFIHDKQNIHFDGLKYISELIEELEDSNYHYLIFPYYGKDLLDYLENKSLFVNEFKVKKIFSQIVKGVSFLHSIGIAHLDLSLENIMIDKDEEIHIIDFGVARLKNVKSDTWICKSCDESHRPGKIKYMCPELFSGNIWEPFSADIFTLGVILYCSLIGRNPFDISTDANAKYIYDGKLVKFAEEVAMAKEKGYEFSDDCFYKISVEAAKLISEMISLKEHRIDLSKVLSHSWFTIS